MAKSIVVRSLESAIRKPIYGKDKIIVGQKFRERIVGSIVMLRNVGEPRSILRVEVRDEYGRGIKCFIADDTWNFYELSTNIA